MQLERIGFVGVVAGVLLGGLVAGAGCDGAEDAASAGGEAELRGGFPFHRRHPGRDAGSAGSDVGGTSGGGAGPVVGSGGNLGSGGSSGSAGSSGSGAMDGNGSTPAGGAPADCEVCTQAKRCCGVVESSAPGCSFSAETCSSTVGDAHTAYVNACLTYVVSVRGVWSGNPPAECR